MTQRRRKIVVVSATASLPLVVHTWVTFWRQRGYTITAWPRPIAKKNFSTAWPGVHRRFYRALEKTDIHFIANENKARRVGYIGAGVFAEIAFSVGLNLIRKKKIEIILYQRPARTSIFYNDIELMLKNGWVKLLKRADNL